jgi:hypothetical protein
MVGASQAERKDKVMAWWNDEIEYREEPDEIECERCWCLVSWRNMEDHNGERMCADCRDELLEGEK